MAMKDNETPMSPIQRAAQEDTSKRPSPPTNPARQAMTPPRPMGESVPTMGNEGTSAVAMTPRKSRPATPEPERKVTDTKAKRPSEIHAVVDFDERLAIEALMTAIRVEHGLSRLHMSSLLRVLVRLAIEGKDKIGRVPQMDVTSTPSTQNPHAVRAFEDRLQQYIDSLLKG